MNESYIPVERDKVSSSSSAETPMEMLNDAARKRQSGVSAGKIQETKGKGAIIDLAGLAYSLAKYNLVQLKQVTVEDKKNAKNFLEDQKKQLEQEAIQLTEDEILESHKHLRHFDEFPLDKAINLTSMMVSQFGLAQFIACTILQGYQQQIFADNDFMAAAEFFTYVSYLKNLNPLEQQDINFDKSIYESCMNQDTKFIDKFRLQDRFIRFVYTLKVKISSEYKHLSFREVPFTEIQKKFAQALKIEGSKQTEFAIFLQ